MTSVYGTCALQMPSSYVLMDTEEMEYLEGGKWTKYTGKNAAAKLATMIAITTGQAVSAYKLGGLTVGLASTGVGMFVALGTALGAAWNAALSSVNALMTGTAAYYYYKFGGFQVNSADVPVIGATFYTGIKKA